MKSPAAVFALCSVVVIWSATAASATTSLVPAREEVVVPKTCTMDRVYKMVGYDCSSMNLKEIPQNLRTNLQVFDVSMNRIRSLNKESFARYSDIKFLYLFENMIWTIEPGTFSDLTDLEALDLSTNTLLTIPLEIFDLPRLRNLYLADNNLAHLPSDLTHLAKPIRAPLQQLNIADCKLMNVPDLGILPSLVVLNISHNDLSDVTPQQFSPFCSLKIIDINGTSMQPCICQMITVYLRKRGLTIKNGITCDAPSDGGNVYCGDFTPQLNDSIQFHECLQNVREIRLADESRRTWLSIVGGLFAFFVVFMGTLYIFHRRNVRQTKRYLAQTKFKVVGKNEILLNDLKTSP